MSRRDLDRLNTKFERLTRVMSGNYGVKVVLSGTAACTDGETVYLPANSDDLSAVEQMELEGFCDHERAHVTEEVEARANPGYPSPMAVMKACTTNREKMMLNVFEDIRVERKYSALQPGTAENLRKLGRHQVELYREKVGGKMGSHDPWQLIGSAVIMASQGLEIDWAPEAVRAAVLTTLAPEVADARSQRSVADALDLARRTIAKIKDLAEKVQQEQKDRAEAKAKAEAAKGKDADQGDQGADVGKGGEQEDQESKGTPTSAPKPQPQANGAGQGAEGQGEVVAPPTSADGKGTGGDKGPAAGVPAGMGDGELGELAEALKGTDQDAETDDMVTACKTKIKDASTRAAVEGGARRWMPDPLVVKADKYVKPSTDLGDLEQYRKDRGTVAKQIHALKARLVTVLRARGEAQRTGDQESGDVDGASLYSLNTGNKRVFDRLLPGEKLDVAVSLLIDESGSMCAGEGSPAHHAKLAAIALAEALDALGVPFEVIGFKNLFHSDCATSPESRRLYTRWLPFQFDVFKGWDEKYTRTKARLVHVRGDGENVDGEAVLTTAKRLAARPEQRKILVVLSDGDPAGGAPMETACWHLGEVVRRVTSSGIEVYGMGLGEEGSKSVSEYYNKANGAEAIPVPPAAMGELAVRVVKLLKKQLVKAAGKAGRAA